MADRSTLYATIAQVLPLLVLALAIERGAFGVHEKSTEPASDAILAITLLVAAAYGETSCFLALAGHASHGTLISAEVAIGLAGFALFADLVAAQLEAYRDRLAQHDERPRRRWLVAGYAVVVMFVAVLLLILLALSAFT